MTRFSRLFALLALSSLSFLGCNRGSNNPVDGGGGGGGQSSSFTLGGATYTTTSAAPVQNNVQQNIDGRIVRLNNYVADAFGFFLNAENATGCGIVGSSNNTNIALIFAFPGSSTGTFQMGSGSGRAAMSITVGTTTYASMSGQLVVAEYGNPGGRIRGTFSGTFTTQTGTNVQVTNGSFNVTRAEIIQ